MDYKLLLDTAVFAGEILMKNGAGNLPGRGHYVSDFKKIKS